MHNLPPHSTTRITCFRLRRRQLIITLRVISPLLLLAKTKLMIMVISPTLMPSTILTAFSHHIIQTFPRQELQLHMAAEFSLLILCTFLTTTMEQSYWVRKALLFAIRLNRLPEPLLIH